MKIKEHIKNISFLINCAYATTKIRSLKLIEPKREFMIRPTLHVIFQSPVGTCKSTILQEISKMFNVPILTEATKPGLVGTIDLRTMSVIPSAVWECRNSLLLMDEFNPRKKTDDMQVFLQLMENQEWKRKIGRFSSSENLEDGDLFFRVKDGNIHVKTRFATIIATMKRFEYIASQEFRAFVSRCVPYRFHLTDEEMKYILDGNPLYIFEEFQHNPEHKIIDLQTYRKIRRAIDYCFKKLNVKSNIKQEIYLRCVGDVARIYAVSNEKIKEIAEKIVRWKSETQSIIGKYFIIQKRVEK